MQKIFSIYDSKAGAYMTPFFLPSVAHATRQLADLLLSNQASPFSDYPEDFTLMEIGEWNPVDCHTVILDRHIPHGSLLVLKSQLRQRREQNQLEN